MLFLLDPVRPSPPRERIVDQRVVNHWEMEYYNPDPVYNNTQGFDYTTGSYEMMYDSKSPRYNKWKDVVHQKQRWSPVVFSGSTYNKGCDHLDYFVLDGTWDPIPVKSFSEIFKQQIVSDMLTKVASRWVDQLYQLRQEPLPDLGVFFAELHEMSALYGIVQDYVRHLILALRSLRDMRRAATRAKKRGNWTAYKEGTDAIVRKSREFSKDLLAMRFGVQQPIRDCIQIIAAAYDYLDHFKFSREVIHVREQESMVFYGTLLPKGCYGHLCFYQGDVYENVDEVKVTIAASTDQRPTMNGSTAEKVLALLLRQFELVPTPDALWEITRLSWLVDYFVRFDKLIVKFSDSMNSFAGVEPVIYHSAVSLKIERTTKHVNSCIRRNMGAPSNVGLLESSHYERITGVRGSELAESAAWLRSNMTTNQSQNSIAFALINLLR